MWKFGSVVKRTLGYFFYPVAAEELIAKEERKGLGRNENLYVYALYAGQNTYSHINGLLNLHIFGCFCI